MGCNPVKTIVVSSVPPIWSIFNRDTNQMGEIAHWRVVANGFTSNACPGIATTTGNSGSNPVWGRNRACHRPRAVSGHPNARFSCVLVFQSARLDCCRKRNGGTWLVYSLGSTTRRRGTLEANRARNSLSYRDGLRRRRMPPLRPSHRTDQPLPAMASIARNYQHPIRSGSL